jgi:hypothetical protein
MAVPSGPFAGIAMLITVESLRRVSAALFDRLEARGYDAVEVPHDYYWDIDQFQRHNLDAEPDNLSVGQLSEDWWNLEEMLRDESLCAVYGLAWLGAVLREVGELIVD